MATCDIKPHPFGATSTGRHGRPDVGVSHDSRTVAACTHPQQVHIHIMILVSTAAALLAGAALAVHAVTALLAWRRCRVLDASPGSGAGLPSVSIVRPVMGLDDIDRATLASTFTLDHSRYEVIFCAERETDPVVPYVRRLIAAHPDVPARMLVGITSRSSNPKLDNIEKGWDAARHDWVVLADANVLMPPDYVQRLLVAWREGTGLVSAPPIGASPASFWAEVECAFLNTYQARWQYAADAAGYGFAQGKNLLWRKAHLDALGGIRALGLEVAEDAAATKLVRRQGRRVRLADRPFPQPLGMRTLRQVWDRQLRWAQLRQQSFPVQFMPEILTTALLPMAFAGIAAWGLGLPMVPACLLVLAFWWGVEALLARGAAWHLSWRLPLAWLVRDVLLLAVWTVAWFRRDYEWRGNRVSTARRPVLRTPMPGSRAR